MNSTRMTNSLHSDQARCYVETDVGPNCLQSSSADNLVLPQASKELRERAYLYRGYNYGFVQIH